MIFIQKIVNFWHKKRLPSGGSSDGRTDQPDDVSKCASDSQAYSCLPSICFFLEHSHISKFLSILRISLTKNLNSTRFVISGFETTRRNNRNNRNIFEYEDSCTYVVQGTGPSTLEQPKTPI